LPLQGTEAVDVTRAKLTRQLAERTTSKMQVKVYSIFTRADIRPSKLFLNVVNMLGFDSKVKLCFFF
jgi:hypothetical protein